MKAPAWLWRLWRALPPRPPLPVVIAATTWTVNGVNVFSANLARGLVGVGVQAQVLLTEEDCDLIEQSEQPLPRPAGVPFVQLPVPRSASWGRHWGAMLRWLGRAQPCVYLPNSDWRHSCVCPLLPDAVLVVGVVHSDDPLHYDHVRRLGRYWNLAVAVSDTVARRAVEACPEIAGRILTIPIGVSVPATLPPRGAGAPVLRVIYHGIFKQHQKRVLDLPQIVEQALALGVPVQLTLVGAGPDEPALRTAAATLVASGAVRFIGLVSPDAIAPLLEHNDVYLLASAFEGMPNALLEAMGRGCVPVVSRMDSAIPELVRDGDNGLLAPVGDCAAFARALQTLWQDPQRRLQMAQRAFDTVAAGGYRVQDMVAAYRAAFERARRDVASGRYRRPRGALNHAPAQLGGVGLFPPPLRHAVAGTGAFPELDDFEDFEDELLQHRRETGPQRRRWQALAACAQRQDLQGLPVFVSAPVWTANGVNDGSEVLVRHLTGAGLDARLLLTEEDTDLIRIDSPRMALPADLRTERLRVRGRDSWGARWGALRRLLESAAPCVYMPNHDWRHAAVVPMLPRNVIVIGHVHDDGPLYREQAQRLAGAWDALVWPDRAQARHARQAWPALARSSCAIPPGLHLPAPGPPQALPTLSPAQFLWLAHGHESAEQQAWLVALARQLQGLPVPARHRAINPPQAILAALTDAGIEVVSQPLRGDWLAWCGQSRFVVVADATGSAWPLMLEAMAQGCVALHPGTAPASAAVPDRHSGLFAPDGTVAGLVQAVRAACADPAGLQALAAGACTQARRAGYSEARMGQAYLGLIRDCLAAAETGLFKRPPGPLAPPPAKVQDATVFPVDTPYRHPVYGVFPSEADARDFAFEAGLPPLK